MHGIWVFALLQLTISRMGLTGRVSERIAWSFTSCEHLLLRLLALPGTAIKCRNSSFSAVARQGLCWQAITVVPEFLVLPMATFVRFASVTACAADIPIIRRAACEGRQETWPLLCSQLGWLSTGLGQDGKILSKGM